MADVIDISSSDWHRASRDTCQRVGCYPNQLAHNEATGRFALVAKRSYRGEQYCLGKTGLYHVLSKDPHAVVVLMNGSQVAHCRPASEWREQLQTVEPYHGAFGEFWWVAPPVAADDKEENVFY